jgi:hypothetical protein
VALPLKMVEESENEWRAQVLNGNVTGLLVQLAAGKVQQQPEAIPVSRHGARACLPLLQQALPKKLLQQDWK